MTYDLYEVETQGIKPHHRTYHGATIIENLMIIVAGEGVSHLADVWILNLDNYTWHEVQLECLNQSFSPRKFHTVTAICPTLKEK